MPIEVIPSAVEEPPVAAPRGLSVVGSAQTDRFGAVYFGCTSDRKAAGVWGEVLPLAYLPEIDYKDTVIDGFGGGPVTIQIGEYTGWIHQPHTGLSNPWSRKRRAFHVELPTRRYTYYLRWFHRMVEREYHGQVLRTVSNGYHVAQKADLTDTAVALLVAATVGQHHLALWEALLDLASGA